MIGYHPDLVKKSGYIRVRDLLYSDIDKIEKIAKTDHLFEEMQILGRLITSTNFLILISIITFFIHSSFLTGLFWWTHAQLGESDKELSIIVFSVISAISILAIPFSHALVLGNKIKERNLAVIPAISSSISIFFGIMYAFTALYLWFTIDNPTHFRPELTVSDTLYFSVVTITTLGYGDIQPASVATKAAASVEAITGILFLAYSIITISVIFYQQSNHASRICVLADRITKNIKEEFLQRYILKRNPEIKDPDNYAESVIYSYIVGLAYRAKDPKKGL